MDFIIIANAWTAAADNPTGKHQIALQLAAKGHRVLWIEGSGMRKPSASSGADRSRIAGKLKAAAGGIQKAQAGIWRTAPLIVPMPTQPVVRGLNAVIYVFVGLLGAAWLRFKRPVLINFLPVVPLAETLWPWKKVYFCVDRWDKFDTYDPDLMSSVDATCCRNADVVLTTSHDLQTRCEPGNPHTTLIGHGVNWKHFSAPLHNVPTPEEPPPAAGKDEPPAAGGVVRRCAAHTGASRPAARRSGETRCNLVIPTGLVGTRPTSADVSGTSNGIQSRPTSAEVSGTSNEMQSRSTFRPDDLPEGKLVGFFGLLSGWVDQELLIALAARLRGRAGQAANLVLIGMADVDISRLETVPNIHILGPKPFVELPQYTAFFNVAIIPFSVNELTVAVNPIKLREMLAAGCPVVSTALPEVAFVADDNKYAETVDNHAAFIDAVLRRLEAPATLEYRMAISDTMRSETWSAKVDRILEVIKKG